MSRRGRKGYTLCSKSEILHTLCAELPVFQTVFRISETLSRKLKSRGFWKCHSCESMELYKKLDSHLHGNGNMKKQRPSREVINTLIGNNLL